MPNLDFEDPFNFANNFINEIDRSQPYHHLLCAIALEDINNGQELYVDYIFN